jgi:hypothetical protein
MGRKRVKPKKALWATDREALHPSTQNYHANVIALTPRWERGTATITAHPGPARRRGGRNNGMFRKAWKERSRWCHVTHYLT